ncbi:MAG: hypothetical protein ABIO70_05730 [Pseudomonadota bacterium]
MPTPPRPLSLMLMALLGGCPGTQAEGEPPGPPPLSAADKLEETSAWRESLATWREAEEVGSGARGDYPFDEAGQKALVARLEQSRTAVRSLQGEGLLTQPEADLLALDVDTLLSGVSSKRPTELMAATCYQPRVYQPRQESLASLERRLTALEALAAQEALQSEVVRVILAQIEEDMAMLASHEGKALSPEEQARAEEVTARVKAALERLKR